MPQIAKGGKFVFGWSVIRDDYTIQLPYSAVEEYVIASENKVILFSGSKSTGGFCVSNKKLLEKSKINIILTSNPKLRDYKLDEGELIIYKERNYCWASINDKGLLKLNEKILKVFSLKIGDKLLSIRGSDIAFVMGLKGLIIEAANNYKGKIESY